MASGIMFYWISWMLWIVITFLMKKDKKRTFLATFILLIIICSNIYVSVYHLHISTSLFLILLMTLIVITTFKKQLYYSMISFTIMIGYMAILIWEKTTPVWFFLPRFVLVPIVIVSLIIILTNGLKERLVCGVFGITAGELVFSLTLSSYHLQGQIADLMFLDCLFVTVLLIILIEVLNSIKNRLFTFSSMYRIPQPIYNEIKAKRIK